MQSEVKLVVKGDNGVKSESKQDIKEEVEDKNDDVKVEEDCDEGCNDGSLCDKGGTVDFDMSIKKILIIKNENFSRLHFIFVALYLRCSEVAFIVKIKHFC